jgi:4-hydroxy-tetrahydrodipicolinate reductase
MGENMIRLIITGACGRMGSAILKLAASEPDFQVTHVVEAKGHPRIGSMIEIPAENSFSLPLEDDLSLAVADCDVIIDFTEPTSSFLNFKTAMKVGKAIVIGTTAMPADSLTKMMQSANARAVISPNMSVGVNLLFNLTKKAASILGPAYDAEIVELHHKWKKDAPSGTAIKLKDIITSTDQKRNWIEVTGRQGLTGERKPDEIGVMAVRAGDIVGEHTVYFAGIGERVEITHRAYSRDNFARGSLIAAKWIVDQPKGVYDMSDVLGLKEA